MFYELEQGVEARTVKQSPALPPAGNKKRKHIIRRKPCSERPENGRTG